MQKQNIDFQRTVQTISKPPMKNSKIDSIIKCKYCKEQATGIIYRANGQLQNVFSCILHGSSLFIPFQPSKPLNSSPFPFAQKFFDNLMQTIITQFNQMKKQVLSNIALMDNIKKTQQALQYTMEGDYAYPYMLLNKDEDMMMGRFLERLLGRYMDQAENRKRQRIAKRRIQLQGAIAKQMGNVGRERMLSDERGITKSISGSPENLKTFQLLDKSLMSTQRKTSNTRDYSKTEQRQPKHSNQ